MTVAFLVVQSEMLEADSHAVLLNFLNIRNTHLTGKERILTHVFEVTSVVRSPVDIYARSQEDILFAVAGFLSDALSVKGRSFLVPSCCETGQCREGCAGVVCPSGLVPLVPFHFRTDAVRTV